MSGAAFCGCDEDLKDKDGYSYTCERHRTRTNEGVFYTNEGHEVFQPSSEELMKDTVSAYDITASQTFLDEAETDYLFKALAEPAYHVPPPTQATYKIRTTDVGGGEQRITDPTTGGQKGAKLCEMGALDPRALAEVGKVAGYGGYKYARYNFAKGYRWSLSYDALQRHLMAFWGGEMHDPESKLPHLAHAAWHCLALLTFSLRGHGTDDRFPS